MNESMTQGVELMFTGMGIVFLFLVMLIGVVNLMAFCVVKFFPEEPAVPTASVPSKAPTNNTAAVTAAITAAVHQHKAK